LSFYDKCIFQLNKDKKNSKKDETFTQVKLSIIYNNIGLIKQNKAWELRVQIEQFDDMKTDNKLAKPSVAEKDKIKNLKTTKISEY